MRKLFLSIFLAVVLIFGCESFVACDDGFDLVKSITITTNGDEKKFSSSTKPNISMEHSLHITEEEFNEAPKNRKFVDIPYSATVVSAFDKIYEQSKITIKDAIKAAKNSTYYEAVEKELEGYWYHKFSYTENGNIYYTKNKYEKTYFDFVYVKVKNDTTVAIRSGKANTTTTYTVTSYKIVEF